MLRRAVVGTAALALCAGCAGHEESYVITMRLGYSGVVRLSTDSFAPVIFPCDDDVISRVQLTIERVNSGEAEVLETILTVEYDPPISSRQILVSTASDYSAEPGVTRIVHDADALRRFNEDGSFLVTIDLDRYLSMRAWDERGELLMVGAALDRRFEANVGELASADYVGPVDKVFCWDGSRAWGD